MSRVMGRGMRREGRSSRRPFTRTFTLERARARARRTPRRTDTNTWTRTSTRHLGEHGDDAGQKSLGVADRGRVEQARRDGDVEDGAAFEGRAACDRQETGRSGALVLPHDSAMLSGIEMQARLSWSRSSLSPRGSATPKRVVITRKSMAQRYTSRFSWSRYGASFMPTHRPRAPGRCAIVLVHVSVSVRLGVLRARARSRSSVSVRVLGPRALQAARRVAA